MLQSRAPFTFWGQIVTSVLCSIQILGGVGCNTTFNLDPTDPSNPTGLLINRDRGSNTLGAIRLPSGESVFLFGAYGSSGLIERIDGAVFIDSEGNESSAVFENGLIKSARSSDGSSLDMTYDEVSTRRIKGHVDLVFAALDETDRDQTTEFDIDLERAAAEVAAEMRERLGLDISDAEPPESPDGKRLSADRAVEQVLDTRFGDMATKEEMRSQLILVFLQFHAAAFSALGFVIVEILSALVGIIFNVMVAVVVVLTRAIVVAMFLPLILLGEVMRAAVHQPIRPLSFELDIDIEIPRRPRS